MSSYPPKNGLGAQCGSTSGLHQLQLAILGRLCFTPSIEGMNTQSMFGSGHLTPGLEIKNLHVAVIAINYIHIHSTIYIYIYTDCALSRSRSTTSYFEHIYTGYVSEALCAEFLDKVSHATET